MEYNRRKKNGSPVVVPEETLQEIEAVYERQRIPVGLYLIHEEKDDIGVAEIEIEQLRAFKELDED